MRIENTFNLTMGIPLFFLNILQMPTNSVVYDT